ncbi:DNA-protecting protein DprA [Neobittarella massiliensis]|uniref:DNA-protecting protein DprA n=1 Tax=Neobittarella massiliensis (ex Bilen et al. 2018) TaxID=2041842 RepID=A0A8J6IM76_9FIRM|nr:DNA-protecting protein DprA [Neobittarella massiliensis]
MNSADMAAWQQLQALLGPGSHRLRPVLRHFGSPQNVWRQGADSDFLTGEERRRLANLRQNFVPFTDLPKNCGMVAFGTPGYPAALDDLANPPALLYFQGDLSLLQRPVTAVVGSRRIDGYGRQVCGHYAAALAQAGRVVLSGTALGADSCAHRAALAAGGKTVAVLPGGFFHPAPVRSAALLRDIAAAGGLILSEYRPDCPVQKAGYYQRNRLLAALGRQLFIPQCGAAGGAQMTADYALKLGRPVYAAAGDIFSEHAQGLTALLQKGARATASPADMGLAPAVPSAAPPPPGSEPDSPLWPLFAGGRALLLEEVLAAGGMSPGAAMQALSRLELEGLLLRRSDGRYAKTKK